MAPFNFPMMVCSDESIDVVNEMHVRLCVLGSSAKDSVPREAVNRADKSADTFRCRVCRDVFTGLKRLLFHESLHRGVRYQCLQCESRFLQPTDLYQHQQLSSHRGQGLVEGVDEVPAVPVTQSAAAVSSDLSRRSHVSSASLLADMSTDTSRSASSAGHSRNVGTAQRDRQDLSPATALTERQCGRRVASSHLARDASSSDESLVACNASDTQSASGTVPREHGESSGSSHSYRGRPASYEAVISICQASNDGEGVVESANGNVSGPPESDNLYCNDSSLAVVGTSLAVDDSSLAVDDSSLAVDVSSSCSDGAVALCGVVERTAITPSAGTLPAITRPAGDTECDALVFVCDICDRLCATRQQLLSHMKVHTNKRLFRCEHCSATFKSGSALNNHTNIHTRRLTHSCPHCHKQFVHRSSFSRHLLSHSGAKLHQCSLCDKRFTQSGALARHWRIHSGERPFSCQVCAQVFTSSSQCKAHVRNHHPGL